MKSHPAILCTLILIHACSVQSMNLGNLFQRHDTMPRGTQQQVGVQQPAPVSNLPSTQEQKIEYEYPPQYPSESYSEYRSESDPYLYNTSSDQDVLSYSWNSSYESSNSSEQIDTKQSMQNNTTITATSTSTSTHQKEHSILNADEFHSNVDVKSTVGESSGVDEVVWNKVTSSPAASSTTLGSIIVSAAPNATSDGEKEEVVLGTAGTTTEVVQKSIFQKSIEWAKDEYVLSILVPVAAGVIFAVTVICTIALCRCCRRCCRRRRFRKKCLPDSVRNLSTSDRKRLLGDMSSDDEF